MVENFSNLMRNFNLLLRFEITSWNVLKGKVTKLKHSLYPVLYNFPQKKLPESILYGEKEILNSNMSLSIPVLPKSKH